MKSLNEDLKTGQFKQIYLLYGEESYLKRQYRERLVRAMIPEGVKTDKSDSIVTQNYVTEHVEIGIASLRMIIDEKKTVKHLKFDW